MSNKRSIFCFFSYSGYSFKPLPLPLKNFPTFYPLLPLQILGLKPQTKTSTRMTENTGSNETWCIFTTWTFWTHWFLNVQFLTIISSSAKTQLHYFNQSEQNLLDLTTAELHAISDAQVCILTTTLGHQYSIQWRSSLQLPKCSTGIL